MRRIYYFTGTGNSLRVAQVIAERMGGAELVSMRCDPKDVPATGCDAVGFVYPAYHWTAPDSVVRFVRELDLDPHTYLFAIATPSLMGGFACEIIEELLAQKGAHLSYGAMVHCVANYALVYPPFPPARLMVPIMERALSRVADEVASRKIKPCPKASRLVRSRWERVMGPYLELKPTADYPYTVADSCVGCGLCSRVCPCSNIKMEEGRPTFLHHCEMCMACVTSCPKRAIGYDLSSDVKAAMARGEKVPIVVRIMGLPEGRKLYRNPYVTSKELTQDKIVVEGDARG